MTSSEQSTTIYAAAAHKRAHMIIRADKLSLSYALNARASVRVFNQQTFTIASSSFVCLVGGSGCGKTSLLRVVGGLLPPSAGVIEVEGMAPGVALKRRRVAFLFQEPVLLPWKTVRANVELPGWLWHDKQIERRATRALQLVGLSNFQEAYPRQLSGGMRARVALARALTQEPGLILMDEPFASLDELTRYRLNLELLKIWQQQRSTVLFVTHSITEAAFLADRVLVMGPRPQGIVQDIPVDLPRPRDLALLDCPEYVHAVSDIREALAEQELPVNGGDGCA